MKRTILVLFLIVTSYLSIEQVQAGSKSATVGNNSDWRFEVTPYVFLPASVTGDSTVAGQTVSLDLDTSDLLELLSFAFSGRIEAWKGDFGLIADLYYIKLAADGTVNTPGPLPINIGVDVDVRQFYLDTLGSYRIVHQPYGADGNMLSLELTGGLRWNYLKQEIDVSLSAGGPGVSTDLGGDKTWVDPMLGARMTAVLDERWTTGARADIGGFGISDTKLTWSITAGFDYRPWETTSLKFGWRAYSIDYESSLSDGAFDYDIFQHGPYAAVTFRFN